METILVTVVHRVYQPSHQPLLGQSRAELGVDRMIAVITDTKDNHLPRSPHPDWEFSFSEANLGYIPTIVAQTRRLPQTSIIICSNPDIIFQSPFQRGLFERCKGESSALVIAPRYEGSFSFPRKRSQLNRIFLLLLVNSLLACRGRIGWPSGTNWLTRFKRRVRAARSSSTITPLHGSCFALQNSTLHEIDVRFGWPFLYGEEDLIANFLEQSGGTCLSSGQWKVHHIGGQGRRSTTGRMIELRARKHALKQELWRTQRFSKINHSRMERLMNQTPDRF